MPEEVNGGVENGEVIKVRGPLPRKRRINLAKVTAARFPWGRVLLAAALIVTACVLFVQYAVLSRFQSLRDARAALDAVQAEFDAAQEILNDYYEARDVYVHITWSDMTAEEIAVVNPSDVAELLERVVLPVSPLDGWSLSGNAMTLRIRTASLEEANELARRLREEPSVEYCAIRSGGRTTSGEDGAFSANSELTIRFRDADNRNAGTAQSGG